jgi:hypothetical protein
MLDDFINAWNAAPIGPYYITGRDWEQDAIMALAQAGHRTEDPELLVIYRETPGPVRHGTFLDWQLEVIAELIRLLKT